MARRGDTPAQDADLILGGDEASLLDIVDNVLSKGVVLSGDVTIGLAQVDLVYARVSLLLCAADRVLPNETTDFMERHSRRHAQRDRVAAAQEASASPGTHEASAPSSPSAGRDPRSGSGSRAVETGKPPSRRARRRG